MGVVIRRWMWLESIGVVSGCFPHTVVLEIIAGIKHCDFCIFR